METTLKATNLKANGESKSIRQLLDTQKYQIDFYQREYKWTTENVIELLTDLENKFLFNYKDEHENIDVQDYSHYFLGSIIINVNNNKKFIVDGQQRLTTITLLLIYLHSLQNDLAEAEDNVLIENLIYSKKFGLKSFNLDIPERKDLMDAIFNNAPIDVSGKNDSIKNIRSRYYDIVENFPESLKFQNGKYILNFFIDWFIESVDLVEIATYSEDDAYTIFETMNDRGLNLSPADMLKGYILTNIKDEEKRATANDIWKKQITKLIEYDKKEESDFFKNWLRAKYAETIRVRKKGSVNKDFENIGVQFHRWVRDKRDFLNLSTTDDFYGFIKEFEFFSNMYLKIKRISSKLTKKFDYVFYNSYNNFTFQPSLLLAPIKSSDDSETIDKKIKLVSRYIDTFIILRAINRRTLGYSSISYSMYNLIKKIRDQDLDSLLDILKDELRSMDEKFDGAHYLVLHSQNKWFIRYLLARITSFIEVNSNIQSHFDDYIRKNVKKPFEVEHIIANTFLEYSDDFSDISEFEFERNKIGNLLLLPKDFNQSFGDMPYKDKVEKYFGQNILAKSLNKDCYINNPSFKRFVEDNDLSFKSYNSFSKKEIWERQDLYVKLIEKMCNFEDLDKIIQ
jgi:uncharacterized protein with ParB-like and HNH nuclease domain